MTRIDQSVCIVTGVGSGIGRELAIQAIRRGADRVIGTDINANSLNETGELVCKGHPPSAFDGLAFDVGNADDINQFVARVLPTLNNRRLILINNAGMALFSGRFQDTPLEDFERLLHVNLFAVIRLTKAFLPYMLERMEGHVVNVSSVFGLGGFDGQSAYCTSKFGVRGFTESLRMELFDSPVNVTCVHPGGIKTNIARNAKQSGGVVDQTKHATMVAEFDNVAITTAASAATQILNAVERDKTRLVIGRDGKQIDWLTRIFPVRYTQMALRMGRTKFTDLYQS